MKKLVIILIVVYVAVFSYLSIRRHNAFYSSYDLANMDQATWTTIFSNKPFSVTGNQSLVSRLNFHSDFILVLLSPFYLIWNDVGMLLILQSIVIGLGALAVFKISEKVLKRDWLAFLLALVYLLNPGLEWTNMYDFHGVSMAMTFLLFMVYCAMEKKWWWYLIFGILAMLTKEQVPLMVSMIGIFVFFFRNKKIGFFTFFSGFLIFGWLVFIVIPSFSETGSHWAWDWFGKRENDGLETSILEYIKNITLSDDARNYYFMLLRPFGFLPILGIPMVLISLPDLVINLLSHQAQMRSITMHYDSGMMVGIILSLILAFWLIEKVLNKFLPKMAKFGIVVVSVWLIYWSVKTNYYYSPLPTTPSVWKWMYQVTEVETEFNEVLKRIPTEVSTASSSEIRPHLTHRLESYNLPNGLESDYIAMTLRNRIVGDNHVKDFESNLINELNNDERYQLIFQKGDYYLFRRNE